jgi:hypothetical protein
MLIAKLLERVRIMTYGKDGNQHESTSDKGQGQPNIGEREFEIGKDESWAASQHSQNEAWFANVKRTYDEYQQESLETIRNQRSYCQKLLSDAQQHDNTKQNIAEQALQNAVETANMVSKQAVRHADIAIDRQWNVDEQGYTAAEILRSNTMKDAIAAAVAMAVQEALKSTKA